MKIAIFTETFLPKIDGIVNTLCYLLDHLADHDHDSIMFAPMGETTQYAKTPIIRYNGYSFPLYPEIKLVPPVVTVREHLELFQPDIVHVVNPISLGLAGMWHARRLDIPVVASYHTDVPGFAERWGMSMLSSPLWAFFRWVHNQADLNLCPSKVTLAELEAQAFRNVKVWTRGVDTDQFHPRHRSMAWRYRLTNGDVNKPLIIFVSRLSPEKRVDWLLPLFDEFPGVRLAIVGDGPARPKLEEQFAGTDTVFTGFLRGHALAQAYAAGDLFIFPAANETLGNVVLEAMASGLPVVAANAGGQLDVVEDGVTGMLFDAHSQSSMLTQVRKVLESPGLAGRLAENGRSCAVSRGWPSVLDGLLDDYQTLITETNLRKVQKRLVLRTTSAPPGG